MHAMRCVEAYGGVLEHPAQSKAFALYGLKPERGRWKQSKRGWICEVWQSAYGHRANKATWLYYVGPRPIDLDWSTPKGTHQIGFQDQRGKAANKPTISGRAARATPPAFRDVLLALATHATRKATP